MKRSNILYLAGGVVLLGGIIYFNWRNLRMAAKQVAGSLGMTRGLRNNNPGNIVKTDIDWLGEVEGFDTKFETFDTLDHGIRALLKLLKGYMAQGTDTPSKIINKYAPSTENDTRAYIDAVEEYLNTLNVGNVGDNTVIRANLIPYLANIIMKVENGVWVSDIDHIKAIYATL